jgi:hypothetical protein
MRTFVTAIALLLAIVLGAEPLNQIVKHGRSPWLWGEVSLDSIVNQMVVLPLVVLACWVFLSGLLAWHRRQQARPRASQVLALWAVALALVAGIVAMMFIAYLACELYPSQAPEHWAPRLDRRLKADPIVISWLIVPLMSLTGLMAYGLCWLNQIRRAAPMGSARDAGIGAFRWAVGAMGWGAVLQALPMCRHGRQRGRHTLKDLLIALVGAVLLLMASGTALGSWRVYQSSGMDWNILIFIAPLVWLALVAVALVLGVCGGAAYARGLKASGPHAPPTPASI